MKCFDGCRRCGGFKKEYTETPHRLGNGDRVGRSPDPAHHGTAQPPSPPRLLPRSLRRRLRSEQGRRNLPCYGSSIPIFFFFFSVWVEVSWVCRLQPRPSVYILPPLK